MKTGKSMFVKFFEKYLLKKKKAKAAMQRGDVNAYIAYLLEADKMRHYAKKAVRV